MTLAPSSYAGIKLKHRTSKNFTPLHKPSMQRLPSRISQDRLEGEEVETESDSGRGALSCGEPMEEFETGP